MGDAGPGAGALARRLVAAGLAHPVPPPPGPGLAASVTAVVPVRDHAEGLDMLVAALLRRCAEVIVVDDGSTDATGEVAAAAGARVLRHGRSFGPAAARLAGAAAAGTALVLFCDADLRLPTGDWFGPLLGHLADPAVAAAAPRVASPVPPGSRASLLERYESARSPLDLGPRPAAVRPGARVSYVPSAALLIRRELAGFDAAMRYGEDVDLVWRLVAAGWSVRYEPSAVVHHQPRSDWPSWARQRFGYGSSAGPLAVRHPGPLRPAAAAAAAAVAALVIAAAPGAPAGGQAERALGAHAQAVGLARRLAHRKGAAGAVAAVTAGRGIVTAARLARRLAAAPHPRRLAWVMVLAGRRHALEAAADNVRRGWWPPLAASGPGRRVIVLAVLIPAVRDWWVGRPGVGLLPYVLLRFVDDVAYSAGVWWGCLRARTASPLLPATDVRGTRRAVGRRREADHRHGRRG